MERLVISDDTIGATTDSQWETIRVSAPRLEHFLMVPIGKCEILFLGGVGTDEGKVILLNLADLTQKTISAKSGYNFIAIANEYSLCRPGKVSLIAESRQGQKQ